MCDLCETPCQTEWESQVHLAKHYSTHAWQQISGTSYVYQSTWTYSWPPACFFCSQDCESDWVWGACPPDQASIRRTLDSRTEEQSAKPCQAARWHWTLFFVSGNSWSRTRAGCFASQMSLGNMRMPSSNHSNHHQNVERQSRSEAKMLVILACLIASMSDCWNFSMLSWCFIAGWESQGACERFQGERVCRFAAATSGGQSSDRGGELLLISWLPIRPAIINLSFSVLHDDSCLVKHHGGLWNMNQFVTMLTSADSCTLHIIQLFFMVSSHAKCLHVSCRISYLAHYLTCALHRQTQPFVALYLKSCSATQVAFAPHVIMIWLVLG